MPKFNEFIFGKPDKLKQFNRFTPEQTQMFQQLFQSLTGGGGQFGDIFGQFNPGQTADVFQKGVADPAMRNFNQKTIPSIMQAFGDQGASSGLSNNLATAGRDLNENLSSQLAQFMYQAQLQNQQNRMGGLNSFLGSQTFQPYTQQGNSGFLNQFLGNFAQGAGKGGVDVLSQLFGGMFP